MGVVTEHYDDTDMPGWRNNSLGYHTNDGKIFHNCNQHPEDTKGIKSNYFIISVSITLSLQPQF